MSVRYVTQLLVLAWLACSEPLLAATNGQLALDSRPVAQNDKASKAQVKSEKEKTGPRANQNKLGAAQETEALAFVRSHHPQLAKLLEHLRKQDLVSYDKALRQLSRDQRRLREVERRDPPRYKLELRLWQAESRIQLTAARLSMSQDESLQRELRNQLNARLDAKLALARLVVKQSQQRAQRAAENIRRLERDRGVTIDRELDKLLRKHGQLPKSKKE